MEALFLRPVIETYPKKNGIKRKGDPPVDQPQSNMEIKPPQGEGPEYPKILVPEKAAINVIMTSD